MLRESGLVKKPVVEDGSTVHFMGRLRGEGTREKKTNTTSRRDRRSDDVRNCKVIPESE